MTRCTFSFYLAWPGSLFRHARTAVTAWLISLRTFGDSYTWLGVGRLNFDLKNRQILISMIDTWTWLHHTVLIKHVLSVKWAWSHVFICIFFLQSFWLGFMENIAIRNQKGHAIKTRQYINLGCSLINCVLFIVSRVSDGIEQQHLPQGQWLRES